MEIFSFNPISVEFIENISKDSKVFNMTKDKIEAEKILLTSFYDEKLGASEEKLDIAIYKDGRWEILDIEEKIEGFNEIPLGYLISSVTYDKVIVVIRRLSTMLLDTKKDGLTTYIYNVISNKYKSINDNPKLLGMLARYGICLDDSDEMYKKLERYDTTNEIRSWIKLVEEGSE